MSYKDKIKTLDETDKTTLEAIILDKEYNDFLRSWSDFQESDRDPHGHGKRIPYMGWYWCDLEFWEPTHIPIADNGKFVGFIVNNKWDYKQRYLTQQEVMTVIAIVDEAMEINGRGGLVSETWAMVELKFVELWEYLQTLKI